MNGNTLKFDTLQGAAWMVDATSVNNCFVIGANVSQSAYRLYVGGPAFANSLASSGTVATSGSLGAGTTLPLSSLQVTGLAATTYTTAGIHAGMLSASLTNPQLSLVPGAITGSGALCWKTTGATTNNVFKILGDLSNNVLSFSTTQGEAMRIDGNTGTNNVLIGTTGTSFYKLHVEGSVYSTSLASGTITGTNCTLTGNITATSSCAAIKAFDIQHPDPAKPDKRLRHRCLEGVHHGTYYTYKVTCEAGLTTVALPDWFEFLNGDTTVFVNPMRHFGAAWGETAGNTLSITANTAGGYNVLLFGIRKDEAAMSEYFGVEYTPA